jgi:hypothetical protein
MASSFFNLKSEIIYLFHAPFIGIYAIMKDFTMVNAPLNLQAFHPVDRADQLVYHHERRYPQTQEGPYQARRAQLPLQQPSLDH